MTSELRAALRRIDRQLDAIRRMPEPIPVGERHRYGIEDVQRGGVVRVAHRLYHVEDVRAYREKRERWTELALFGLEDGETGTLEWERNDGIEVRWSGPRLRLGRLGLDPNEIEEISDEGAGAIELDGRRYHYRDDHGATVHRGDAVADERVYVYDFQTHDGRACLRIEERGDEASGSEYAAVVSERLEPNAIEVLALRGDGAERS